VRIAGFWIAAGAAMLALASIAFAPLRPMLSPAAWFVGVVAGLFFVRMLFSRSYRRGFDAVHHAMYGDRPWPARPRKKLLDPEWGLFGWRSGTPALIGLRAAMLGGLLPSTMLGEAIDPGLTGLWVAGTFLAMELTLMYAVQSLQAGQAGA
jgi:hypothetical protein